ncbi:hypothetical protein OMP43_19480 [Sphingomonas sp. CBMAI 2297]|uniref:hypothetical protein n=1 Tax=Sphingomonas sp. CBMAI 2297 TaxID=2991720 RepID=UPI002456A7D0|nr:hypothetical protein [Sphingomonas sp. CBMAI 2297]MDH4746214.1 hypothetical protein [Sphingomonas sp. CBMAI 2297]
MHDAEQDATADEPGKMHRAWLSQHSTDRAAKKTNFPKEVADKALAHKIPDRVEAAYQRTDFFMKRRLVMDERASFLEHSPAQQPAEPKVGHRAAMA